MMMPHDAYRVSQLNDSTRDMVTRFEELSDAYQAASAALSEERIAHQKTEVTLAKQREKQHYFRVFAGMGILIGPAIVIATMFNAPPPARLLEFVFLTIIGVIAGVSCGAILTAISLTAAFAIDNVEDEKQKP